MSQLQQLKVGQQLGVLYLPVRKTQEYNTKVYHFSKSKPESFSTLNITTQETDGTENHVMYYC